MEYSTVWLSLNVFQYLRKLTWDNTHSYICNHPAQSEFCVTSAVTPNSIRSNISNLYPSSISKLCFFFSIPTMTVNFLVEVYKNPHILDIRKSSFFVKRDDKQLRLFHCKNVYTFIKIMPVMILVYSCVLLYCGSKHKPRFFDSLPIDRWVSVLFPWI